MPIRCRRRPNRTAGGHDDMAGSSPAATSGPGGHRPASTTSSTHSMVGCESALGPACMPKRRTIPSMAAIGIGHWSAARWCWSRSSACHARHVFPSACGCGGADRANPTWRSSGGPTSGGSIWSTPTTSVSRASTGPRRACGRRSKRIVGRGWWCWPPPSSAWPGAPFKMCTCRGRLPSAPTAVRLLQPVSARRFHNSW